MILSHWATGCQKWFSFLYIKERERKKKWKEWPNILLISLRLTGLNQMFAAVWVSRLLARVMFGTDSLVPPPNHRGLHSPVVKGESPITMWVFHQVRPLSVVSLRLVLGYSLMLQTIDDSIDIVVWCLRYIVLAGYRNIGVFTNVLTERLLRTAYTSRLICICQAPVEQPVLLTSLSFFS